MTPEELKAHIDDHKEKYGDADPEDSAENDAESPESENLDGETFDGAIYDARDSHRSTGPRTPAGKAISSQNATKHGCRSKTLVLSDEDPAKYEAVHQGWWDKYQPSGHAEETLVKQLIDNNWYLMRAIKRMEQVESELPTNVHDWTDAHQKMVNTFTRYKTTPNVRFTSLCAWWKAISAIAPVPNSTHSKPI